MWERVSGATASSNSVVYIYIYLLLGIDHIRRAHHRLLGELLWAGSQRRGVCVLEKGGGGGDRWGSFDRKLGST